jgi:hypothetical protein
MEEQGRFEELDAQGQERKESAWASDLTRCDREQQRWAESEAIAEQCAALHLMDLDEAWRGEGEKEGGHFSIVSVQLYIDARSSLFQAPIR